MRIKLPKNTPDRNNVENAEKNLNKILESKVFTYA